MKISPRNAGAKRPSPDEIKGLQRALDKTYARLRERARAEWARHHGGKKEPADARVSVRITATSKAPGEAPPQRQPAPRLLPRKSREPRRKIPRTKAGRRK